MGVFSRKHDKVTFREASVWTLVWVGLSVCFYFFLLYRGDLLHGIRTQEDIVARIDRAEHPINIANLTFDEALDVYRSNLALEYITGYLIEYSLSVDNIFVFILIFTAFGVDRRYYKRVLMYGIVGAVVLRLIFIFAGAALIHRFHWILYAFGFFLIYTGVNMFLKRNRERRIEAQNHPVVKFASRYFAVYPRYVRNHFFVRQRRKFYITPLFLVLLILEFSDVIFAVDSIPAIFSVTKDPYIVFFSNIFAILGLRSLFFLVMNFINLFHYLRIGLSVLLVFIGVKMLLDIFHIVLPTPVSLIVIISILLVSMLASIIFPKKKELVKNG
jgi:tellurite resistance protein TerC